MAFSHYSNQVESKLDAEARLTREKSGRELFDELIRRASGPRSVDSPLTPDDIARKAASSPLFNLLYVAVLRRGAKDWCSNTLIQSAPMTSTSAIEYHHVFPKAKVQRRYGPELTNSLSNLAFISGFCNRKIGAKDPALYLKTVHADRLAEQWAPAEPELWRLEAFESFLAGRRTAQARALNDLLGLPPYVEGRVRGIEDEVPRDDDLLDGVEVLDDAEAQSALLGDGVDALLG